jgi:hypothetical protein
MCQVTSANQTVDQKHITHGAQFMETTIDLDPPSNFRGLQLLAVARPLNLSIDWLWVLR